jgi:hypothetical protein
MTLIIMALRKMTFKHGFLRMTPIKFTFRSIILKRMTLKRLALRKTHLT